MIRRSSIVVNVHNFRRLFWQEIDCILLFLFFSSSMFFVVKLLQLINSINVVAKYTNAQLCVNHIPFKPRYILPAHSSHITCFRKAHSSIDVTSNRTIRPSISLFIYIYQCRARYPIAQIPPKHHCAQRAQRETITNSSLIYRL